MTQMNNILLILILALQLTIILIFHKEVLNDWCSSEIDILRTQMHDIWIDLGLDDE